MPDASQTSGVNSGTTVTPAAVAPVQSGQPPATENAAPVTPGIDGKVPYERFQEVIRQKNEYATKLKEIEGRLAVQEVAIGSKSRVEASAKAVEKLTAAGMDKAVAELMVETQMGLVKETVDQRIAPLEQKSVAHEVDIWTQRFAEKHSDFSVLEPEMNKVFTALPEHTRVMLASDPVGLELLYSHVKANNPQLVEQAKAQGASDAYANKGLKQAMSSAPGAAVAAPVTISPKDIGAMSLTEWEKVREGILAQYQGKK